MSERVILDVSEGMEPLDAALKEAGKKPSSISKEKRTELWESLEPWQAEMARTLMDEVGCKEYAIGARQALIAAGLLEPGAAAKAKLRRRRAPEVGELARLETELAHARESAKIRQDRDAQKRRAMNTRIVGLFKANQELCGKVKGYEETIAELRARLAQYEPQAAEPEWDYARPPKRERRSDEVITDVPFGVEVMARQVEDFVARMGGCSKPDVSARFPNNRGLLAEAYRHLHASKRVHVSGWRLEPWDEVKHGRRGEMKVSV